MLTAIIELPHTAISRYDWLVYIINVVLTHNRNRTLANLCEVINHSLHRNTLADGYFCVAMLYLDDYVFFVVVLNQAVYVCWVYAAIKSKTFEVDELFHPLWIQDFTFHKQSSNSGTDIFWLCFRRPASHGNEEYQEQDCHEQVLDEPIIHVWSPLCEASCRRCTAPYRNPYICILA